MGKKSRVRLSVISIVLLVCMAIVGISAYYIDRDTVVNEFVVGGIDVVVKEPSFMSDSPDKIIAKQVIAKDPQVYNQGNNDAFVFVEVVVPCANIETNDENGNIIPAQKTQLFTYEKNDGWVLLETIEEKKQNTYVYAWVGKGAPDDADLAVLKPGETTGTVFDSVKFANVTKAYTAQAPYIQEPNTVSGVWTFNKTLEQAHIDEQVDFTVTTDVAYQGEIYTVEAVCSQMCFGGDFDTGGTNFEGYYYTESCPFLAALGFQFPGPFAIYQLNPAIPSTDGWYFEYGQGISTVDFGKNPQDVSPAFYEWLLENATRQDIKSVTTEVVVHAYGIQTNDINGGKTDPEGVWEVLKNKKNGRVYTVSGVYAFKDNVSLPADAVIDQGVNFTAATVSPVDGNTYVCSIDSVKVARAGIGAHLIQSEPAFPREFGIDIPSMIQINYEGEWLTNAYGEGIKTWDFGSKPQAVTYDFYVWLTANAVRVSGDLPAGLYQTGTETLVTSWSDLIADKVVYVKNGVVYTNVNINALTNSSAEALVGDLVLPNDGSITALGDFDLYDGGVVAFAVCDKLTKVVIPDSVTSIGAGAFAGCAGLTEFEVPDSVTSIELGAFYGCVNLTKVTIPENVTHIDPGDSIPVFSSCLNLTEINVDANNPNYCSVDGVLFTKDMKTLMQYPVAKTATAYVVPDSVTNIGREAFAYCTALVSIELPEGLITTGRDAFYYCSGLKNINIPDGSENFGWCAFERCTSLQTITIPDSWTCIDDSMFYGCTSLTTVNIGKNVRGLYGSTFGDCYSLTTVNFAGTMEEWSQIFGIEWVFDDDVPATVVNCSDGTVELVKQ